MDALKSPFASASCGGRRPVAASQASIRGKVQLYDLHDRLIPYERAWEWQRTLVDRALLASSSKDAYNTASSLLLLQHPPVYTLGAGSSSSNILFDPGLSKVPVHRTERGGEVTFHGPGQLVLYPILDLQHHEKDLHLYMRQLEEVVIRALKEVSGIQGGREDGLTGVWVQGAKVAAIGIRAKRWVTFHGLALNIGTDLSPFDLIVPCGIRDRRVTSVRRLLEDSAMRREEPSLSKMATVDNEAGQGAGAQSSEELIKEYRYALLEAFEEVFQVDLVQAKDADLLLMNAN